MRSKLVKIKRSILVNFILTLSIGIEFSGLKGKPYLFLDEVQNVGGCCQTKRR